MNKLLGDEVSRTANNVTIIFKVARDMGICGVAVLMFFFFNAVMR